MLRLTPEAAVYLHNLRSAASGDDPAGHCVVRVVPAALEELRGLKLSLVAYAGEGDFVSESQGFYLSIHRDVADELDNKLIDTTPDGESMYIRSA
jgi:hypothetical protein